MTNPSTGAERPERCPRCESPSKGLVGFRCNTWLNCGVAPHSWHDASPVSPATPDAIECGTGENRHLLLLNEPGNLKQLVIEFLKWDGGEGSRAYDASKYCTLRQALRNLVSVSAAPSGNGSAALKWLEDNGYPTAAMSQKEGYATFLLAPILEKFAQGQGERIAELEAWKESAMTQLGKSDALKELLPKKYWGWDVYDATVDYVKSLVSESRLSRAEGASQWISVAERLPEESERVLVWYNEGRIDGWRIRFGYRVCGHWRPEGGNGNFDSQITHWQPLPDPPKVAGEFPEGQ